MEKLHMSYMSRDLLSGGATVALPDSRPSTAPCPLPIILLAGPTAVGKTELSLRLAARLSTEIINADSMQVYRHMDIGTAKPSAAERSRVPHHLLDVVNPDEPFDAAAYLDLARPVIDGLHRQGRIPLVVGGTGLYMKVLTRGICPAPPTDPQLREQLKREDAQKGLAALHGELLRLDPPSGKRIHPNDRQRVHRALEVLRLTGIPLSVQQETHRFRETLYPSLKLFLFRERDELYRRIDDRVHVMMRAGFLDEVRGLIEAGYGPELPSMKSLGYRQLARFLAGETDLEQAVADIAKETRRYAKRQFTWFRADPEFQWFHGDGHEKIFRWIEGEIKDMERLK